MARPIKWRKIEYIPPIFHFIPAADAVDGPANVLKLEELEAVRLKDLAGLEQEECAEKMAVSRPTFQRILGSAREKIADSLIYGKAIRVEGGNFTRNICRMKCMTCGAEQSVRFEELKAALEAAPQACPECGSAQLICESGEQEGFCRRNCWRRGWGKRPG